MKNLTYYLKRIYNLGLSGSYNACAKRAHAYYFTKTWRQKALAKKANHTWEQIAQKNNLGSSLDSFTKYLHILKNNNFIDQIMQDKNFHEFLPQLYKSNEKIITQADKLAKNCFNIFSGDVCFPGKIAWHTDFKHTDTPHVYGNSRDNSWAHAFYQDIRVSNNNNNNKPDVKTPWELSRFCHVYTLGRAYQISLNNQKYAQAFYEQINDWIDQNPYLIGINWRCPMDVAIRAINFIWGFYFFVNNPIIPEKFWQKLVCSLYDHAHYIENNWETSDKPNNHYLADLLGYLYLNVFFLNTKLNIEKSYQTHKKILEQINHQIQADGSSYEGSTKYHRLVLEIILHVKLVCHTNNSILPEIFVTKFELMKKFMRDCTDQSGNLVTIGDDDSGTIVTGIELKSTHIQNELKKDLRPEIIYYKNFGLSIIRARIRAQDIYITMRHPAYQAHQPSGHFHQDQLAITLSIGDIPILIDPGSYVYTSNTLQRNNFRSVAQHNTFYIPQASHNNRTLESQDLFQLARRTTTKSPKIDINQTSTTVHDMHTEYDYLGYQAHRTLNFNTQEKELVIRDRFEQINQEKKIHPLPLLTSSWTLLFDPTISIEQKNSFEWIIRKENSTLIQFTTTLSYKSVTGYYAPAYGTLQKTQMLVAEHKNITDKHVMKFLFK